MKDKNGNKRVRKQIMGMTGDYKVAQGHVQSRRKKMEHEF